MGKAGGLPFHMADFQVETVTQKPLDLWNLKALGLPADIIDGKAIAGDIRQEIKQEVAKLKEQTGKVSCCKCECTDSSKVWHCSNHRYHTTWPTVALPSGARIGRGSCRHQEGLRDIREEQTQELRGGWL